MRFTEVFYSMLLSFVTLDDLKLLCHEANKFLTHVPCSAGLQS